MTNRRQWTLILGIAMAVVFTTALVIRVLPEIELVGVGANAPAFHAIDLATSKASGLEAYRGRPILLNIWATWCPPCRVEMPSMQRLWRHMQGTDFRIVAVSIDVDDSSAVTAFAKQLGLTFDILHDQSGRIQKLYQTTGVPESFVIDRHGVIVKKVISATEWDAPVNEMLIRRLLDER